MSLARKSALLFILSITIAQTGIQGQLCSRNLEAGDDEYIRLNLSEPFVYYMLAHDTLFVSCMNFVDGMNRAITVHPT